VCVCVCYLQHNALWTEHIGSGGKFLDLYSGVFISNFVRVTDCFVALCGFYSALPSKYQVRTSYYVTTASFHILSNSLFSNCSTIQIYIVLINPLKPSGHYMYHQFNIQQYYVLPTRCIFVFCVDLRTNSDYFPIQH